MAAQLPARTGNHDISTLSKTPFPLRHIHSQCDRTVDSPSLHVVRTGRVFPGLHIDGLEVLAVNKEMATLTQPARL